MPSTLDPSANPHCAMCKHHHTFALPDDILEAARKHRLVVFAGAGISTESSAIMPYTFYDEIAAELGHDPKTLTTSFPALMAEYCQQPNGRRKMLQMLKARFDYIESFPQLLRVATHFHEELSTVPHLDAIVTTNWDTYFEQFCGATPFVAAQDFVFWDMPGRKVFKIHGSVTSYSSVIATNEDYERCHEQLTKGIVGSNLKMLLATKVVLFVGYSLRDHDFSRIYEYLKSEMKDVLPHAYAIAITSESANRFKALGLTPILTDGTFFFQVLKSHLATEGLAVADERFDGVLRGWAVVRGEHDRLHKAFSYKKNPEMLFCASYQDGLMDAFGRIVQRKMAGEYSCPDHVVQIVRKYLDWQNEKRRSKDYADVAYIEGYINGLQYLLVNDRQRKSLPLYFMFGHSGELTTLTQYKKACKRAKTAHRSAYKCASRMASRIGDGVVFHHTPFLF